MREGQYRCASALCPFYKKETRCKVFCSGIKNNTSIHYAFGNATDCYEHKKSFCRSNKYKDCFLFKMLCAALSDNDV